MENTMITFHGKKEVKKFYIDRVRRHRLADELVQGQGWENGRGCAVGCCLESYEHSRYPIELGIPQWLAYLEDHIFETLAKKEAMKWPEQFLKATPIGVEESVLNNLRDRFQIFWLERQKSQIDCVKFSDVSKAIDGVIELFKSAIDGSEPESAAWSAARGEAIVKRDWLLAELKALK